MIKKLTTVGNSLGLIIERPILELLDIDRDTLLDESAVGQARATFDGTFLHHEHQQGGRKWVRLSWNGSDRKWMDEASKPRKAPFDGVFVRTAGVSIRTSGQR